MNPRQRVGFNLGYTAFRVTGTHFELLALRPSAGFKRTDGRIC